METEEEERYEFHVQHVLGVTGVGPEIGGRGGGGGKGRGLKRMGDQGRGR